MAEKNHIRVYAMTLDIGLRVFPDFQILDLSAGAQARRPCHGVTILLNNMSMFVDRKKSLIVEN
jgi:hypothetical protein